MSNNKLNDNNQNLELISEDLSNNNLFTIPRSLYNNKSIKYLDLSNNNIEEIPEELIDNLNLFSLNISNNKIKKIPKKISLLKDLRLLNISQNQIEFLPDGFSKLTNLKYLDISKNNFVNPPKVIDEMTWLISFINDDKEDVNELSEANTKIRQLLIDESWKDIINSYKKLPNSLKLNIQHEFGFILEPLLRNINSVKKDYGLSIKLGIWKTLSSNEFLKSESIETLKIIKTKETVKFDKIAEIKDKNSEEKGEMLEESIFQLFDYFFSFTKKVFKLKLKVKRKQNRGRQFGFDLKMEFSVKGKDNIKVLIECKNYSTNSGKHIILKDIADKLVDSESYVKNANQWILISPYRDPENSLDELINQWKDSNKYPFRVQIWSPQNRVDEFFGLVPYLYDMFGFKPRRGEVHPKDWDDDMKFEVIKKWMDLLTDIPLNLPTGWTNYIFSPHKLRLFSENINELEDRYRNHVNFKCLDRNGELLELDLNNSILRWLTEPVDSKVLILLGEFGDGKSTYTYLFSRMLLERFKVNPKNEWIPIRFSLNEYNKTYGNNIDNFLKDRLEYFGENMNSWDTIKVNHNLLIILDGFDEMSIQLDQDSLNKTLNNLINCIKRHFHNDKIIITSRKPFFQEHFQNNSWLYEKLNYPEIHQIAPISYKKKISYLEKNISKYDRAKLNKLKELHDPLGLASKALFLQMVKETISDLPEDNINEVTIYENYINKTIRRKETLIEKSELQQPISSLIENLKEILEIASCKLYTEEKEYVYLSQIVEKSEEKCLAKILWDISEVSTKENDDAIARLAVRSLLSPVEVKQCKEINLLWPVRFCHRSMREYFFARWIYKALVKKGAEISNVLKNIELNHEVILFVKLLIQMDDSNKIEILDFLEQLLISSSEGVSLSDSDKKPFITLGRNSVNIIYQITKKLEGKNWTNIMIDNAYLPEIDLSNKNFSGSSLRYANLNNSNLFKANFTNADITGVNLVDSKKIKDFSNNNGQILGIYEDNSVWAWTRDKFGDFTAQKKGLHLTIIDAKLKVYNNSFCIIYNNERVFYYSIERDNKLKKISEFRVLNNLKLLKIVNNLILLLNPKEHYIYLVELNPLKVIRVIEYIEDSMFDLFDNKLFVYYIKKRNVIEIIDHSLIEKWIIEDVKDINSIATYKDDNINYLATGDDTGYLSVWTIEFRNSKCEISKTNNVKLEEEGINKIEFIEHNRILYSTMNGKLGIFDFDNSNQINLQNKINFKGMIINGLKSDHEYNYLKSRV